MRGGGNGRRENAEEKNRMASRHFWGGGELRVQALLLVLIKGKVLRVLQRRYLSPTSRCRFSIPGLPSSIWAFFRSLYPESSSGRLRLCGDSSDMATSWEASSGMELPLTLCAGVGRVVIDVIELVMLTEGSVVVVGEKCEGL